MIKTKRNAESNLDLDMWIPCELDESVEMTMLVAIEQITGVFRGSKLNKEAYDIAARPIGYLADRLQLTPQQAVLFSMFMSMFHDTQINMFDITRFFDIQPLALMHLTQDIEHLCKLRFIRSRQENGASTYRVAEESISAIKNNTIPAPKSYTNLDAQSWFEELNGIFASRCCGELSFEAMYDEIAVLSRENSKLLFVQKFNDLKSTLNEDEQMLLLWCCNSLVSEERQHIIADNFREVFGSPISYHTQRRALAKGKHKLLQMNLLRIAKIEGPRPRDCYELTPEAVNDMLSELDVEYRAVKRPDIIAPASITPKQLFYNPSERVAIDKLTELLEPSRFKQVRAQLRERGFRSGFACLFHGAPGTGKTETVLQLARKTGRNLMQVDVSEVKSMWVGESEKNIREVFVRYRKLVKESEIAPILLFNEADAIISKRIENILHSTDQMTNAMQNIILEEIEKLDGILIATTNLTCNLDKAFDRRFLYKIEFKQPSLEAKCSIWLTMIPELSATDARTLASKYNLSGGQIENIARKSVVDNIISSEEVSLEALISHCDSELMGKSVRHRIGY